MGMAQRAAAAVWVDTTGRTRLTIVKASTNPCSILNALVAISQGQILQNWDGTLDGTIGAAPVLAQYTGVDQWVQFVFGTGTQQQLRLSLPAPQLGIFLADQQTVDQTNAGVVALVGACVGNLSDGVSSTATGLLSAMLMPTRSDLSPIG
jgi:hypothetical protein